MATDSRYRFKHAVDAINASSKVCVSLSDTKTLHDIESVNATSMFVQVGVVMVAFSITVMVAVRDFTIDLVLFYIFVVVQIIHILFLTIQGQFVINSHDAIFDMITQALYVMVLRRCLTPPVLTAGGLIPQNLNTFAEIVKASVSYFTVLKSS